jgi:hypothetical protein
MMSGSREGVLSVRALMAGNIANGLLSGSALLKTVLENKSTILKALLDLSTAPKEVVFAHDENEKAVEVPKKEEAPSAADIVRKVDPMYLWELHMCVLGDQVNPVAGFALPDRARRMAVTACCFGKTGVAYDAYVSSKLFKKVAKLLKFPKIVHRAVNLQLMDGGSSISGFLDYLDPVVAAESTQASQSKKKQFLGQPL